MKVSGFGSTLPMKTLDNTQKAPTPPDGLHLSEMGDDEMRQARFGSICIVTEG